VLGDRLNQPVSSTIRDALQGEALADFNPSQFESQGGQLFYSLNSATNQVDVNTLVKTFQAVHLPSLGQVIPQSGEFVTVTVSDTANDLLRPTGNQVYRIEAIDAQNATLGDLTATVTIANKDFPTTSTRVIVAEQVIALGDTASITIPSNLYIDSNASLMVEASGASLAFTAYVAKVVQ